MRLAVLNAELNLRVLLWLTAVVAPSVHMPQ